MAQDKAAHKRTWRRGSHRRTLWARMWDRTGFRGMTVRNWLELLIIPLALAVIGFYFSAQQDASQQQIEDQRSQDAILQAYLDEMGSLMLNRDLRSHDVRTSEEGDTILTLARARTTTTIRRLDAEHNRSVTRFLTNVGLTGTGDDPSRTGTDPFKVLETQAQGLLYRVDLQGADLAGAFLPGVDLTFTELQGANLSDASLRYAALPYAFLQNASLQNADLSRTLLLETKMQGANLSGADLIGACLFGTDLTGANLSNANLTGANLTGASPWPCGDAPREEGVSEEELETLRADLKGADFSGANLEGAVVTEEQLEAAESLEGATMPDGSVHD